MLAWVLMRGRVVMRSLLRGLEERMRHRGMGVCDDNDAALWVCRWRNHHRVLVWMLMLMLGWVMSVYFFHRDNPFI